jgi:hypothetical protein
MIRSLSIKQAVVASFLCMSFVSIPASAMNRTSCMEKIKNAPTKVKELLVAMKDSPVTKKLLQFGVPVAAIATIIAIDQAYGYQCLERLGGIALDRLANYLVEHSYCADGVIGSSLCTWLPFYKPYRLFQMKDWVIDTAVNDIYGTVKKYATYATPVALGGMFTRWYYNRYYKKD